MKLQAEQKQNPSLTAPGEDYKKAVYTKDDFDGVVTPTPDAEPYTRPYAAPKSDMLQQIVAASEAAVADIDPYTWMGLQPVTLARVAAWIHRVRSNRVLAATVKRHTAIGFGRSDARRASMHWRGCEGAN